MTTLITTKTLIFMATFNRQLMNSLTTGAASPAALHLASFSRPGDELATLRDVPGLRADVQWRPMGCAVGFGDWQVPGTGFLQSQRREWSAACEITGLWDGTGLLCPPPNFAVKR